MTILGFFQKNVKHLPQIEALSCELDLFKGRLVLHNIYGSIFYLFISSFQNSLIYVIVESIVLFTTRSPWFFFLVLI